MHIKQISSYPELHFERNHDGYDLQQEFNFLIADRDKALSYEAKNGEMLLTVHRWFARKSCPGNWLFGKLGDLAQAVNSRLGNNGISLKRKS